MTLYEFRASNDERQANEVWNGVLLDVRNDDKHSIFLYALGIFYVEAYYDPTLNQFTRLRLFKSTNQLQPYLDHLDC